MYLGTRNLYLVGRLFSIIFIVRPNGEDRLLIVLTTFVITLESGGSPFGRIAKIRY